VRSRVRSFAAFWYDFVVGDDWRVAVGVMIGLALTYGLSRTSLSTWWIMPVVVGILLSASLWRVVRTR
jgi:phage shock protein PspC (stress-responsive transcriptional regulator)